MEDLVKKLPNWRSRLNEMIELRRRTPIQPGYHCGIFVCDCILAMTGTDLAEGYRDHETMQQSLDKMHADGFEDMASLAAHRLAEIEVTQARMGDVVLIPSEETGWAGGVMIGERVAVLRHDGIGTVPRDLVTRAFRV